MQRIAIIGMLCLAAACNLAQAQEQEQRLLGIGVSLNPTALVANGGGYQLFLPVGMTNIRVAITPSPNFRAETEFGIYSQNEEQTGTAKGTETFTSTRAGVNLFYRAPIGESFSILVGPRFGLVWMNATDESGTGTSERTITTTETDLYAGAALGGEYMLSPNFGIGAEAQLNYVKLGEPDTEYTPSQDFPAGASTNLSRSMVTSNALVFFHFYF